MSNTVDLAFIRQFEREVHEAYQQQGSKLRGLVRTKNNIVGKSTTFQRVGRGHAVTKARHGVIPVMNVDHSPVEVQLSDYYAGDWSDALDELKLNIDERVVIANAGAWALGRKTDELIITAAVTATNSEAAVLTSKQSFKGSILEARRALGEREVPDDGRVFGIVSWKTWEHFMNLQEFADADYVGPDLPFMKTMAGLQKRTWLGTNWITHTGLPIANNVRTNILWHHTALGHAVGADISTDITWHGDRAAHFIANSMSQGAGLIDDEGVQLLTLDESVAVPAS